MTDHWKMDEEESLDDNTNNESISSINTEQF